MDHMLQQPDGRGLQQHIDHLGQHAGHCIETLRGVAHILQALRVQQQLLNDEGGHCLGELAADLHDLQAERYDLGVQKEANDLGVVHLHQCPDDTQRGEPQILERPLCAVGVEEGVQKQWDLRLQEPGPSQVRLYAI